MSKTASFKRKIALGVIGLLAVGLTAWGVAVVLDDDAVSLPKELSVESLKAASEGPGQMRERIHEAFQREDLTEEQRQQLRHNLHQVMEAHMDQRLDEYFTADTSQRQAVLDRHLDEMQARMRERQREGDRRPEGERGRGFGPGPAREDRASARSGGADADNRGPGPPDGAAERPEGPPGGSRGFRGPPSREHRKERSESRNPDRMARHMAYFTALRQRAEQRGIQMPFGPRMGPPPGR